MIVRLLVSRSGPAGAQSIGDCIDVGDQEAIRMIEAGQAEPVRSDRTEKAVRRSAGERASK